MSLHTSILSVDLMAFLVWQLDRVFEIDEGRQLLATDEPEWTVDEILAQLVWRETIEDEGEFQLSLDDIYRPELGDAILDIAWNERDTYSDVSYFGCLDAALASLYTRYIGYAMVMDNDPTKNIYGYGVADSVYNHCQYIIRRLRDCGARFAWEKQQHSRAAITAALLLQLGVNMYHVQPIIVDGTWRFAAMHNDTIIRTFAHVWEANKYIYGRN